jgi:hypothetical protein
MLNVVYPPHVESFLQIFKVATLQFIPNPFSWMFGDYNDQTLPVNPAFMKLGLDGIFIKNVG